MESFSSQDTKIYQRYFFYSLERAQENLESAVQNYKGGRYNVCISNTYYAAFHVARGLLALKGTREVKRHPDVRSFFGEVYIRKGIVKEYYGKMLAELERERITADYDVEYAFSQEQASSELKKAIKFLSLGSSFAKVMAEDEDFRKDWESGPEV